MIRLFIALEIPGEIRNFITSERKKISDSELRWEPPEKLHITLKFIGSFPEPRFQELTEELSFIKNYSAFILSISGFGFFQQRILWLGFSAENNLLNLVDDLNKHLIKFNIEVEEKKYKPHLTLLRIPKDRGNEIITAFRGKQIMNLSFSSSRVILYKSELSPKGSIYTPLKIFNLKSR